MSNVDFYSMDRAKSTYNEIESHSQITFLYMCHAIGLLLIRLTYLMNGDCRSDADVSSIVVPPTTPVNNITEVTALVISALNSLCVYFSRCEYKYQLSQTDPRDASHAAHGAVHRAGRSV